MINSVVYELFKNCTWNQMDTWTPEMYSNINHFCSIWPLNKYEFLPISDPVQSVSFNCENDVVIEKLSRLTIFNLYADTFPFVYRLPTPTEKPFCLFFGVVMTNMFLLNYVMYFVQSVHHLPVFGRRPSCRREQGAIRLPYENLTTRRCRIQTLSGASSIYNHVKQL